MAIYSFLLLQLSLILFTYTLLLQADETPTIPAQPLSHPSVKLMAVRGVVYCKSCKYRGKTDTLGTGATPLLGAMVKLQCNTAKNNVVEEHAKTDKNGFFFLMTHNVKVTETLYHKCKVFLVSSPTSTCAVPTNFHGGASGADLVPTPVTNSGKGTAGGAKLLMYTVGPFAFEPHKDVTCH